LLYEGLAEFTKKHPNSKFYSEVQILDRG